MRNLILLAAAVCFASLSAENARAAPPQKVKGTFVVTSIVPTSVEQVGDFTLIEAIVVFTLEGALQGPMTSEFVILRFGALDEPAPELFFAVGTFEGSVAGNSGSLEYVFFGDADAQGNAEGDLVILSGAGDLKKLRGRITLQGITGVGGVYSGRVR